MKDNGIITEEMLLHYITGTATLEEEALISIASSKDEYLKEFLESHARSEKFGISINSSSIPITSAAATSEGNLCDVLCELYILKYYLKDDPAKDYAEEAADNCWLKDSGTPLHSMGRLLEKYGMSVARRYDCTIEDICNCLAKKTKVIAVVDYGQLWNGEADGQFHAVVCLSIVDDIIRIYDPAIDGCSNYDVDAFTKAWSESKYYLVSASTDGKDYIPHPVDLSDVSLDNEILELMEAIAENAHEVWAQKRIDDGWKYGDHRDDDNKIHPDLIPFSDLSENEKDYDRDMARSTIGLLNKMGFFVARRYTRYCPHCGEYVSDDAKFCPECGAKLPLEDF